MALTDFPIAVYYKNTCSVLDTCLTYTFAPNRKDKNMKVIAQLFGTLIKAVLALLILALLTPVLYFAWRANQPMDMPEFKGLAYVQYMDWRKMALDDIEAQYLQSHPGIELVPFPLAVWYMLTPSRDDNKNRKGDDGCYNIIVGVDVLRAIYSALHVLSTHERPFFAAWWPTFEEWVWDGAEFIASLPNGSSCRLPLNVPTPEQYEAMKQERRIATP